MTSSTALGMPTMPPREGRAVTGAISFTSGHYFSPAEGADPAVLAEAATAPLSVIVQVTKRCDFGCMFCSETLQLPDPALTQLETIRDNLAGVHRVFLSGGEPLLRRDLVDIVNMFSGFIIGLPTNATRGVVIAPKLAGKIAFANIGFDGPRATFRRVRGDYNKVMTGVRAFSGAGIPISKSAVVQRSGMHGQPRPAGKCAGIPRPGQIRASPRPCRRVNRVRDIGGPRRATRGAADRRDRGHSQ